MPCKRMLNRNSTMPEKKRLPLLLRSLLVGIGAFSATFVYFLLLPFIFGIPIGTSDAFLYAISAGAFFAIASWYADRDEEFD